MNLSERTYNRRNLLKASAEVVAENYDELCILGLVSTLLATSNLLRRGLLSVDEIIEAEQEKNSDYHISAGDIFSIEETPSGFVDMGVAAIGGTLLFAVTRKDTSASDE